MKAEKPKLYTMQYAVLFFCAFAAGFCLYSLNSVVPLYVDHIGGSAGTSGMLNTCFSVSACIARALPEVTELTGSADSA